MFSRAANLRIASRFSSLTHPAEKVSGVEIALLVACGFLAALAMFAIHLSFRVPGHAILRAVFPMAAGLAVVPRRGAGLVMTIAAALTGGILRWGNIGEIQPAALVSLLALGPLLDLVMLGEPVGWRLYARFIASGVAANIVAFATRVAITALGYETPGGHQMDRLGWLVPVSFLLCGAIAGLVSAITWFRLRPPS